MKISRRAHEVTAFLAMEISKQADAMEATGQRVIRMNIGEPDFGAPQAVIAALRDQMDGRPHAYTAALGLPALREAIAGFYQSAHGLSVDPGRVVVTAGASAALLLLAAALIDPGDRVLVADPSYPCNRHFLHSFGAEVALVPTTPASRFQLDLRSVQAHWNARTRGVLIASPSNPTGTSVRPEEMAALCAWLRAQDAWRVVDEIYLNLADHSAVPATADGQPAAGGPSASGQQPAAGIRSSGDGRAESSGHPAQSALACDPDAIVVNSFSKYFGMTGWRLGWCVAPAALIPALERLAQNYYICASAPAQQAALACFAPESLAACEARRQELASRRQLILQGLAAIGLPLPVVPDGAFYVYFDVGPSGMDAMQFCERALREAGVALTPGADFGVCSASRHVRLSYATSREALQEGLARLANWLGSAPVP